MKIPTLPRIALTIIIATSTVNAADRHLLLIAGTNSHGDAAHNHKEGMHLFATELKAIEGLKVSVATNGWPEDEALIDQADAIVFYSDGLARHYESDYSCNPMWTAKFTSLPGHPITMGVEPFEHHEKWYFNMRFRENMEGVIPILAAKPSDETRDGPYVNPKGPYPHIQAEKGREEVLMWAVERDDGGRGFGFAGGHFHKGWDVPEMRCVVLNAMLWVSKVERSEGGAPFTISVEESDALLNKTPN